MRAMRQAQMLLKLKRIKRLKADFKTLNIHIQSNSEREREREIEKPEAEHRSDERPITGAMRGRAPER